MGKLQGKGVRYYPLRHEGESKQKEGVKGEG